MPDFLGNAFVLLLAVIAICGVLALGCLIEMVWTECVRAREARERWATVSRPTTADEALRS